MRRQRTPAALARLVRERAHSRCEYCLSPESTSPQPFVMEHVEPRVAGGPTVERNLALACPGCNGHKYTKTHGTDPVTGSDAPLFNPRTSTWADHFRWNADYDQIVGITPSGRATVYELHLNRPSLLRLRAELARVGLHPPTADHEWIAGASPAEPERRPAE